VPTTLLPFLCLVVCSFPLKLQALVELSLPIGGRPPKPLHALLPSRVGTRLEKRREFVGSDRIIQALVHLVAFLRHQRANDEYSTRNEGEVQCEKECHV